MEVSKGYLLSYIKYSDRDAILHMFLHNRGYESFFFKGVYSPKSKKKAYLMPLKELQIQTLQSQASGTLKRVSNLDSVDNRNWSENIKASTVVFFISDFLNQTLRNESQNIPLYEEISSFCEALYHGSYQSHLIFLARMLLIQGHYPLVDEKPYLDPETGEFADWQSHHLFDATITDYFRQIYKSHSPYSIKIPHVKRANFLEALLFYYQHHQANFKAPKSLEIVRQLFQEGP